MSDERLSGQEPWKQVEDRIPGAGFGAGSEGAGSEVWDREPSSEEGRREWVRYSSRGGEREAARRRVEANPSVLPPHPLPVDRHAAKVRQDIGRFVDPRWTLPFLGGLFATGMILSRFVVRSGGSRALRAAARSPELVLALRSSGWRNRRAARQLAQSLRGRAIRGILAFQ